MSKRKRVGGISQGAMIAIGGVGIVGLYLLSKSSQPAAPVVVRTAPSTSAGTTAAEIAAGGAVVTAALNDFFGPDSGD